MVTEPMQKDQSVEKCQLNKKDKIQWAGKVYKKVVKKTRKSNNENFMRVFLLKKESPKWFFSKHQNKKKAVQVKNNFTKGFNTSLIFSEVESFDFSQSLTHFSSPSNK